MRVSRQAENLLENNTRGLVKKLQEMPLEALLDSHNLRDLNHFDADPLSKLTSTHSIGPDFICPVSWSTLVKPVVVSSGQIYSEDTVLQLLESGRPFVCPITREPLSRDCYDDGRDRLSYIRLPQLNQKILEAREQARRAAAPKALDCPAPSSKPPVDRPCVDTIIAQVPDALRVNLRLYVSGAKLRVEILYTDSTVDSNFQEKINQFFRAVLPNTQSQIVPAPKKSTYNLVNLGRCWQTIHGYARLEFWFPMPYRITDTQVNQLSSALVSPLALPDAPVADDSLYESIASIGSTDFFLTIPDMEMPLSQALKCCLSFLKATEEVAESKGISLQDEVNYPSFCAPKEKFDGFRLFGRAPGAFTAAASALVSLGSSSLPPAPSRLLSSQTSRGLSLMSSSIG